MKETGEHPKKVAVCINKTCQFRGKDGRFPGSGCSCEQEQDGYDCPKTRIGEDGALLTTDTKETE